MGRRGPAPTPTAALELRGSWRADTRGNEPQPPLGRPSCPRWLNPEAKKAWRQLAPQLHPMGVLTRIDAFALGRYCQLWARWRKMEAFIERHGEAYPLKDDAGRIKCFQQFPQVSIANKLAQQLTRLEQEFGMTPSARTRIEVQPQTSPDAMEEYLKGKGRFFQSASE